MKKIILIIQIVLFLLINGYSQLLLNEMMSNNFTVLEDQFGEYPDWIEIYNSGVGAINLENVWLSDDILELNKWKFPSIVIPEDTYMVIFASGKNIQSSPSYWHTLINVGDEWKYLLPETNLDDSWKSSTTATVDWSVGKSGIGYTDGDDSTIISQTISIYMQKAFDISNLNAVTNAMLYMDYDDGFIAYLNGTEIARSISMGDSGRSFSFDEPSISGHEATMYNGNIPESYAISDYLNLLQEGENILAIEVHNVGITSSDMSAIPFFLLGFNSIQEEYMYQNPYLTVNNEYPHTNFKIASEGEAIYLSNGLDLIYDSISMIPVPVDCSYGRLLSEPNKFGYYNQPTPSYENNTMVLAGYITDTVEFIISGEFDESTFLKMETLNETDTIYYTTNGSEPDSSSLVYANELEITSTKVIRARILRYGNLPGLISSRTIFKGRQPDIPRFSIITDPENLFDYYTGIYELGPNAQPDWPYWGANFWQDWEKPAYFEIFDVNGEVLFSQDAGIKIYGGSTRALPNKSFSFHARSGYGDGSFSYQLFSEKDIYEYESFIIRNNGGDGSNGMFRDAITGHLAGKLQVDHQGYKPVALYLNGVYWGIINMREKLNEHFVASNHHVHADDVNMFQDNASLMSGSRLTYDELESYVSTHDLTNDDYYNVVKGMMDVDNFIRYWLLEVYVDNWDWPQHNIKFWSTNAPGSLYKWVLYDTDFAYDLPAQYTYKFNSLKFSLGISSEHPWVNADWSNLLINALLANEKFKNSFINQMADRMNTDFLPENIVPVVDSFKQNIYNEAPYHFERWGGSMTNWFTNLNRIENFINYRAPYIRKFYIEQFNLTSTAKISVFIPTTNGGKVRVNSIIPEEYPFNGIYYNNVPIQLEAIPAPGYKFVSWEGSVISNSTIIDYDMKIEGSFTAIFEEYSDTDIDIVINEINYFSAPERDTEDWIELYNNSSGSVDLSNWGIADGPSGAKYNIPSGTIIAQGGYITLTRKILDFKRFFPETPSVFGDFDFGLSRSGESVAVFDEIGVLHDFVTYESISPWPTEPNGEGATLELINPNLDNSLPSNWKASLLSGSPSEKNSQFVVGVSEFEEIITSSARLFPSVFHDLTTIEYNAINSGHVCISVISLSGVVIDVLTNNILPTGNNRIIWNPKESGANPGLYIIRIETSESIHTLKCIYQ